MPRRQAHPEFEQDNPGLTVHFCKCSEMKDVHVEQELFVDKSICRKVQKQSCEKFLYLFKHRIVELILPLKYALKMLNNSS